MLVIGPLFHTLDAGINIVMTLEFLSLVFHVCATVFRYTLKFPYIG